MAITQIQITNSATKLNDTIHITTAVWPVLNFESLGIEVTRLPNTSSNIAVTHNNTGSANLIKVLHHFRFRSAGRR